MDKKDICIVVFNSYTSSTHLFKILKDKRFDVELMSTPCTISAGCSRAIRILKDDLNKIIDEIMDNTVVIKGIYDKVYNPSGIGFHYEKIF